MYYEVIIVIFLLIAVAMIALILVQQGKGAGMGASFGAGASNTVFGSVGSGNFLTRSTWVLAFVFFGICLLIGYLQKVSHENTANFSDIGEGTATQIIETAPAVPVPEDTPIIDQDVPSIGE